METLNLGAISKTHKYFLLVLLIIYLSSETDRLTRYVHPAEVLLQDIMPIHVQVLKLRPQVQSLLKHRRQNASPARPMLRRGFIQR